MTWALAPEDTPPPSNRFQLPLAVLEPAPRALLSVLLALFHSRIARQKSILPQRRPQLRIKNRKRTRKSHAHGTSLSADAAALHDGHHFDLIGSLREFQRLDRRRVPRYVLKIFFHRAAIHCKSRRSRLQINARDGLAPPSRSIKFLSPAVSQGSAQISSPI